jgi:hypothetical protein
VHHLLFLVGFFLEVMVEQEEEQIQGMMVLGEKKEQQELQEIPETLEMVEMPEI